jgi:hypothetical protein
VPEFLEPRVLFSLSPTGDGHDKLDLGENKHMAHVTLFFLVVQWYICIHVCVHMGFEVLLLNMQLGK